MTSRHFTHAPATRDGLTKAMETAPVHLHPIIEVVRDHRVGMLFVPQNDRPFGMPRDGRPAIIIIGDDFDAAYGPAGFHPPSIRRAIRACSSFVIVSSAPPLAVYATAAAGAATRRQSTMLIETRPEQELAWLGLVQKLAPRRHVTLATVYGGHA